jgi:hypothetical protein
MAVLLASDEGIYMYSSADAKRKIRPPEPKHYDTLPDGYVKGVMSSGGRITLHVITELYGDAHHVVVPLDNEQVDRLIYSLGKANNSTAYIKEM